MMSLPFSDDEEPLRKVRTVASLFIRFVYDKLELARSRTSLKFSMLIHDTRANCDKL